MASKMRLIGVSRHKGTFEGRAFDYTRCYFLGRLDPTKERIGFAGIEMRGLPEIYESVRNLNYTRDGIEVEVEVDQIALGKGETQDMIVSVKPITSAASAIPAVK